MSINYFSKIISFVNESYNISSENIIYIPTNKQLVTYAAIVVIKTPDGNIITPSPTTIKEVYFLNRKTGNRYAIKEATLTQDSAWFTVGFNIDSQSYENSESDYLEISLDVGGELVVSGMIVTTKYIHTNNRVFEYIIGNTEVRDSNLTINRNKIGFPQWSTVHKNTISVSQKLLEPLNKHFSSVISKSNEYLKQTFDLDYDVPKFTRIALKNYPKFVYRLIENKPYPEELVETSDIYSSINKIEIQDTIISGNLLSIVLDPLKDNLSYLININYIVNNGEVLYIRNLRSNTSNFVYCIVTGIDERNIEIQEMVILRFDMYTKVQNKFKRILDITCSETIEVSNYVDLRHSFYIDTHPYVRPAITDRDYSLFKPNFHIKTNGELTNNFILIDNSAKTDGQNQYQFCIKEKINSMFVDDYLNAVYITENDGYYKLNYSKFNLDLTKKIGNKTVNNNDFIEVSDTNTSVGDWVDITIYAQRYRKAYNSKSIYIEVNNKDLTYFYNYELNTLTPNKNFIYLDVTAADILEFSIFIDNSNPFIFSLVDETKNVKYSAMTETAELKPYLSEELTEIDDGTKYLIYYNDNLYIQEESLQQITIDNEFNDESHNLYIVFENYFSSSLNYRININDDFIDSQGSSVSSGIFTIYDIKDKGTQIISLDMKRLYSRYGKDLEISVGASYSLMDQLLPLGSTSTIGDYTEPLSKFKVIYDNENLAEEFLNPRVKLEPANEVEYRMEIDLDNIQNLTIGVISEYDS